jgi:hypothetical protein
MIPYLIAAGIGAFLGGIFGLWLGSAAGFHKGWAAHIAASGGIVGVSFQKGMDE